MTSYLSIQRFKSQADHSTRARALAVILPLVTICCTLMWMLWQRNREYCRPFVTTSSFLAEDAALAFAKEVLQERDGKEAWQPEPDGRTKAPDGSHDVYLVRNVSDPNRGYVV